MRILFDEHTVDTAYERSWSTLQNGTLLDTIEGDGYDLLITTDTKLKYQQNLASRRIAIIVLLAASWPRIQKRIDEIRAVVGRAHPGSYEEVPI